MTKIPFNFYIREDACAILSEKVYDSPDAPGMPPGFIELGFSNEVQGLNIPTLTYPPTITYPLFKEINGEVEVVNEVTFGAKVYFDEDYYEQSGNGIVYVAFCGTLSYMDYIEDIFLALEMVPDYFKNALMSFSDRLTDYIVRHFGYYGAVVITGHSLGGGLAQALLCKRIPDIEQAGFNSAVTFDSPGTLPIIKKLIIEGYIKDNLEMVSSGANVKSYVGFPNAINSCNTHLPRLQYRLDLPVDLNYQLPYPDILNFFTQFTLRQHKIKNFVEERKDFEKATVCKLWPSTLNKAFEFYKSLNNHQEYWYQYMTKFWEQNPQIHDKYAGSIFAFEEDFKRKYLLSYFLKNTNYPLFRDGNVPDKIKHYILNNEVAKLLQALNANCDLNVLLTENKRSYLHIALMSRNTIAALLLLQKNVQPDLPDALGNTPLHYAAINFDTDHMGSIVQTLQQLNVAIAVKNKAGHTPSDLVKQHHPHLLDTFKDMISNENKYAIEIYEEPRHFSMSH